MGRIRVRAVPKSNLVVTSPKKEEYLIHDNGGRPYQVKITEGKIVHVHRQIGYDENENCLYAKEPFQTYQALQVFIGCSPKNEWTEFSGGWGPNFDGNTILIEIETGCTAQRNEDGECVCITPVRKYVFIGSQIRTFETQDLEIVKYVSMVGNNDVPYPYAIDEAGNVYLIIEDVILRSTRLSKKLQKKKDNNPYEFYYNSHNITTDRGVVPPEQPLIKNFKGITNFFINQEPFTLTYSSKPRQDYHRMQRAFGKKITVSKRPESLFGRIRSYLTNRPDQKIDLSCDDYIKLMLDFGEKIGYSRLESKLADDSREHSCKLSERVLNNLKVVPLKRTRKHKKPKK